MSSKCYFSLGQGRKPDNARSGLMVSEGRRKNQGVVSLHLLSHFYKDEVFEFPLSVLLLLHNTAQR